ncbi:MAG: ABC transporter permease [Acidimicrobiales bacterium]
MVAKLGQVAGGEGRSSGLGPVRRSLGWARRPQSLVARNFSVQVRAVPYVWATGLVEPFLYLLSIGIGIGHLVGKVPGPHGALVPYAAFVAPGLLATSAMNGAVYEATTNIFAKLHWTRLYEAVIATPLAPADIAAAEIGFAVLRCLLYGGVFLAVMAALGDTRSWWALLAVPCVTLVGAAFATAGFAATCYMRSWTDFDKIQLVIMPLFLFSATFYPLSDLPRWLQLVVQALPLYPGVALCRELSLGQPSWDALGHVAYLVAMTAVGAAVARRRVVQLLTP